MAAPPARLAWIDACRGIAATVVLLYHAARHFDRNHGLPALKGVFQFGHAGVDLFFVVSGFIILSVHFDDVGRPERFLHYLQRRVTRVMPAYWVALALTILIAVLGGHTVRIVDIAWSFLPLPADGEPLVAVAWTLQYEFVFYAAFAVMILSRIAGLVVLLTWLTVIASSAVWTGPIALPEAFRGIFGLEFFAGMAAACLLRWGRPLPCKILLVSGASLVALAAIAEDLQWINGYAPLARLIYGVPCTLLVLGAAEASRRGAAGVPTALQILGSGSYSLYLFHFLFIGMVWQLWLVMGFDKTVPPLVGFGLMAGAAIVGGIAMSHWVEYPLMHLMRDSLRGRARAAQSLLRTTGR